MPASLDVVENSDKLHLGRYRGISASIVMNSPQPVQVLIVAVPETAGSALYGMVDVLSAVGTLWQTLVDGSPPVPRFAVRVIAPSRQPFVCGNQIPVTPALAVTEAPAADVVIVPEIWLDPDSSLFGRHQAVTSWLQQVHKDGAFVYSACSGSILLAESGLLDGCDATSHWGYESLFRRQYPQIRFRAEPNLAFADPDGRIVTAGGSTSWHDLALHIVARHASPAEALRLEKLYLLKRHEDGQLPFTALVRRSLHADRVVKQTEQWLQTHFAEANVLAGALQHAGIPERSLKRRFRTATGTSMLERLQDIRVEAAKALLEQTPQAVDEISLAVGYEDTSFFRRLFRRSTGLTPSQYRRMFRYPVAVAGTAAATHQCS